MAYDVLVYYNDGEWKKAEELEVQVMDTRKRVLGAEHPDTLSSMANLVSTYRNHSLSITITHGKVTELSRRICRGFLMSEFRENCLIQYFIRQGTLICFLKALE